MKTQIDKKRFGPWALITGASSGIGKEFARQIAASGINVVLVARREKLLVDLGISLSSEFGVQQRAVALDLSEDGFINRLAEKTNDLDIGLVVSNAGTGSPGKFLTNDVQEMENLLRLNTRTHLRIAHYFAAKLCSRKRGGLLFVGAMAAEIGFPYMANDAGAKAYVQSFAQGLHVELAPAGVHVTVLTPGATETPVLEKFGMSPDKMPMKPMSAQQCVSEGLGALIANRSIIIPGRLNRAMNAIVPQTVVRRMLGKLFEQSLAAKASQPKP